MLELGTPPEDYLSYTQKLREEYEFLTDQVYFSLRIKVSSGVMTLKNRVKVGSQASTNGNDTSMLGCIHQSCDFLERKFSK